jgi:membrane protein implicated in regulation of membrane protease activity
MQTLAQVFHDISPPINYWLVAPWLVFMGSAVILLLSGLLLYYARKLFRKKQPERSPRERAIDALNQIEPVIEKMPPYQFSIRVSDILRRYVLEQFDLPMTRQTSVEFLNAIASSAKFGEDDKALLADFLNRCDLIKFARYEATKEDSHLLLEEARRFVKGGTLVPA